jgi:LysM repeat protein
MKGGYGSGMNNPSVAPKTAAAATDDSPEQLGYSPDELERMQKNAGLATAQSAPAANAEAEKIKALQAQNDAGGMDDEIPTAAAAAPAPAAKALVEPEPATAAPAAAAPAAVGQTAASMAGAMRSTGQAAPKPAAKSNPAVLKQQQDLIAKGAKIKADGIMGPATQAAIKQFAAAPAAGAGRGFVSPTAADTKAAVAAAKPAAAPATTAAKPAASTNETAELNRILRLSGMELIAEGSVKSITVQRGDTLGRIARDNSTTVAAIVKLNAIANPDRIYPGDVIRIPGGQGGDPGGRTKRQANTRIPDRAEKLTTTTSTGNPKIAMEFFLDQGWTPEQAAGLVANLQAESYDHIDPAAFNAKEQAYGIAQWRGPRKRDFEREMGRPIKGSSLDDQLKFVQWELNNTEKRAGRRLKQATTAAEAAAIVDEFYERSAGIHRQERIALANSLMTAFA